MRPLYKSAQTKAAIMKLYEEKLTSLGINYKEIDINTSFGRTRVITAGPQDGQKVVIFHGINAGAPLALEAVKELTKTYKLYAIDTIGQATKSDDTRLNVADNSYGQWAFETVTALGLHAAHFIGVSYGAFILQRLIAYNATPIQKCIFIVPGGFVNGSFGISMAKLTFPLLRFLITKKDEHLHAFTNSFLPEEDDFMFRLQRALLTGVNMDYRRPAKIKAEEVAHFQQPVYMIVADDDIFFPGHRAVAVAKRIFRNFKAVHVLKNCKHMPSHDTYPEIAEKLQSWLTKEVETSVAAEMVYEQPKRHEVSEG